RSASPGILRERVTGLCVGRIFRSAHLRSAAKGAALRVPWRVDAVLDRMRFPDHHDAEGLCPSARHARSHASGPDCLDELNARPVPVFRCSRLSSVLVPCALLLPLLAFLDRAVMVDDTLYLKAAAQIRHDPFRPYNFVVNWSGTISPFWDVFKNPPALSYWLALVQSVGGSNERRLHASLLPFDVAAAVAGIALARRFVRGSPYATALWLASPAFLVSASTLMADVPALACTLWGLVFWIEGIDGQSRRRRW